MREPEIANEIAALHKAIDMTKHEVERLREKISAVLRVPVPGPPPALNQGRIGVNVPRTPLAGVIKDARDKLTQSNNEIAEIIDFCEL